MKKKKFAMIWAVGAIIGVLTGLIVVGTVVTLLLFGEDTAESPEGEGAPAGETEEQEEAEQSAEGETEAEGETRFPDLEPLELARTFSRDDGFSFRYPDGWDVLPEDDRTFVLTPEENPDLAQIVFSVPVRPEEFGGFGDTALEFIDSFAAQVPETDIVEEVSEYRLGDYDGASVVGFVQGRFIEINMAQRNENTFIALTIRAAAPDRFTTADFLRLRATADAILLSMELPEAMLAATVETTPEPTEVPTEVVTPVATEAPTEEAMPAPTSVAEATTPEPTPAGNTLAEQEIDGFTFNSLTYISDYPNGFDFSALIMPPVSRTIQRVELTAVLPDTTIVNFPAAMAADENRWVASAFEDGDLVTWQTLTVFWAVTDDVGNRIETTPTRIVYSDETRNWERLESGNYVLYALDVPREVAVETMAALSEANYEAAFGGVLFDPTLVLLLPAAETQEIDETMLLELEGEANPQAKAVIVRVSGAEPETVRAECLWNEARDTAWTANKLASGVRAAVARLYQTEFYGANAPAWWLEGTAALFRTDLSYVEDRLVTLALSQDFPSLQGEGPAMDEMTPASDGCTGLGRDLGLSFVRWLLDNYGGLPTHVAIVGLLREGLSLEEAIGQQTGIPFAELENSWRAEFGLSALAE